MRYPGQSTRSLLKCWEQFAAYRKRPIEPNRSTQLFQRIETVQSNLANNTLENLGKTDQSGFTKQITEIRRTKAPHLNQTAVPLALKKSPKLSIYHEGSNIP